MNNPDPFRSGVAVNDYFDDSINDSLIELFMSGVFMERNILNEFFMEKNSCQCLLGFFSFKWFVFTTNKSFL